jgi:hypothetical protein
MTFQPGLPQYRSRGSHPRLYLVSQLVLLLMINVVGAEYREATALENHMETQNDPRLPSSFKTYK